MDLTEEIKYTQNFSILRIVTNSTPSVVAIILFTIFLPQFFGSLLYTDSFYLISAIIIEAGLLLFIILHCRSEYKYSAFYITSDKIVFQRFNRPKQLDHIAFNDIKSLEIKSFNVVITNKKGEKLVLEYLSRPKELLDKINKLKEAAH